MSEQKKHSIQTQLDSISMIILAYNEEDSIKKCALDALKAGYLVAKKCEVIVVLYDGSVDKTRDILNTIQKDNNEIKIVLQAKDNKGYGAALKIGFANSRYNYVFYTDADNQFDLLEIKEVAQFIPEYDIVACYRKTRNDQIMRRVAARVYNTLVRTFFRTGLKDVDCAFKIYKKEYLDKIKIKCNTGMAVTESIVKSKRAGAKIKQVGVNHYSREKGKGNFDGAFGIIKFSVVKNLLKDMRRLWIELHT